MPDCITPTGRCSYGVFFARFTPCWMVERCAAVPRRCPSIIPGTRRQSFLHTGERWVCPEFGKVRDVQQDTGQAHACIFFWILALSLLLWCPLALSPVFWSSLSKSRLHVGFCFSGWTTYIRISQNGSQQSDLCL